MMAHKFFNNEYTSAKLDVKVAGLLFGGILSDTLGLTSNAKPQDFDAVEKLFLYLKFQQVFEGNVFGGTRIATWQAYYEMQAIAKADALLSLPVQYMYDSDAKEYHIPEEAPQATLVIGAVELYLEDQYEKSMMLVSDENSQNGMVAMENKYAGDLPLYLFVWLMTTKTKKSSMLIHFENATDKADKEELIKAIQQEAQASYTKESPNWCLNPMNTVINTTQNILVFEFGNCVSRKSTAQPILSMALTKHLRKM